MTFFGDERWHLGRMREGRKGRMLEGQKRFFMRKEIGTLRLTRRISDNYIIRLLLSVLACPTVPYLPVNISFLSQRDPNKW